MGACAPLRSGTSTGRACTRSASTASEACPAPRACSGAALARYAKAAGRRHRAHLQQAACSRDAVVRDTRGDAVREGAQDRLDARGGKDSVRAPRNARRLGSHAQAALHLVDTPRGGGGRAVSAGWRRVLDRPEDEQAVLEGDLDDGSGRTAAGRGVQEALQPRRPRRAVLVKIV